MITEKITRPFLGMLALLATFFLTSPTGWSIEGTKVPTEVKLLTIGNSFAENSTAFLPQLAQAGGKKLLIFPANLGGHSFEQHAGYMKAYEADPKDPKGSPYKNKVDPKTGARRDFSLREALESDAWDYVTIQQFSQLSFKPETFEPHAGSLVEYIHKYAPKAKILVLQTWAYRQDHGLLSREHMSQEEMHEKVRSAYHQLASRYGLQILPVGDAIQAARALPRWHFTYPDPNFDYVNPKEGTLPVETGSLNNGWRWSKNAKTGEMHFNLDGTHCNASGCYLASSVLYDFLFADLESNTFCPPNMNAEDVAELRKVAHETVVKAASAANAPTAVVH